MTPKPDDPLEDLLRTETDRLSREALEDPRQVTAGRIEALGGLARLVEIRKSQRSPAVAPAAWSRWAAPVVLAVTLVVLTLLLFTHVRTTEIELDARVSEVALRLADDGVLLEGAGLTSLGVAGAHEISIRHTADWSGFDLTAGEGRALSLTTAPAGDGETPSISLSSVRGSAGARVWIEPGDDARHVTLTIQGDRLEIQASLVGPIRVAGAGMQPQTVRFALPRPALFRMKQNTMSVDLVASEASPIRLSPQLRVEGLSLYHVEQHDDYDRRLSSLISGSLYLSALNGSEVRLRAGQEVRLDAVQGEIRTVQLLPRALDLQFHGYVGQMQTGSYKNPRNLMPSWLEWLRARHGVSLLWGTAFYVFGIISAALRWFRGSHAVV